jgi:hypothetical protein
MNPVFIPLEFDMSQNSRIYLIPRQLSAACRECRRPSDCISSSSSDIPLAIDIECCRWLLTLSTPMNRVPYLQLCDEYCRSSAVAFDADAFPDLWKSSRIPSDFVTKIQANIYCDEWCSRVQSMGR